MPKIFSLPWIISLRAKHRLLIAVCTSLIVLFKCRYILQLPTLIMVIWITYSTTILIFTWITIFLAHPRQIRIIARLQDSSRTLIFLFVIVASSASFLAVIILLKSVHGLSKDELIQHIVLSIISVLSSWILVHTLFTLRYAHLYYGDSALKYCHEGLDFPCEIYPDYLDFAYFSFIIGITCQTSDISITSRKIRRLALMHGILTFGFNTIIVALTINVISGLLAQ